MTKQGYDKTEDGKRINNGMLTGKWRVDQYGAWWEYKLDHPKLLDPWRRSHVWVIGEYPKDYYI